MLKINNPKKTCRLGQLEKCCIYLVVGEGGFQCVKGTSTGDQIKRRKDFGKMNADGEGDWPGCVLNPKGENND